MTATQRREKIYAQLLTAAAPVSATALARQFGVSRQIIVGDIALLRAGGCNITATPRGYVIVASGGITVQLAVCHSAAETRDELYAMVDCGCLVQDVIVEHPVYGQLTAPLQLASRYDVDQFIRSMTSISLDETGKFFDNRDHSTVLYSIQQVEKKMKTDTAFAEKVKAIKTNINSKR